MTKYLSIIFCALLLISQAFADQCSVIPKLKANKALSLLKNFKHNNSIAVIDKYCKACRDESPQAIVIDEVSISDFQIKGYREVKINNEVIDLAYYYLNGENIAQMVGCNTIGVDRLL